ncbi:MAG: hypothetical protein HC844_15380 [Tabrizicola sp.]|nr:hypothetical protein [Tabrizicola sp.]
MGHDWIFDVLVDLRQYAVKNDMPLLAAQAQEALVVARAEIARRDAQAKGRESDIGRAVARRKY